MGWRGAEGVERALAVKEALAVVPLNLVLLHEVLVDLQVPMLCSLHPSLALLRPLFELIYSRLALRLSLDQT